MPDSPLVELKKALNAVVPRIIDRGHVALALDENASDPALAASYSKTIEAAQVFLSSATPGLREIAGDKASLLSAVKVTGELDAATLAALDMLVQNGAGRPNTGTKMTVDLIAQVADKARALPEAQRSALNSESRRLTAARNPAAVNTSAGAQARELMAISDSYLGVSGNPGSNTDVLENTGRALKDYLKTQKAANPQIDIDFTPQKVDGRTAAFMQELLKQKMQAAGVRPADLKDTLFQLWMMERNGQQPSSPQMRELGRVGAMSSLVDYIVSGRLPGGVTAENKPRTDSPWENPVKDRFFNRAVYVDLLNGDTVSEKSLLRPGGADPGQQQLIREAMQKLGISTEQKTYSRDQVGAIATEIMVLQARAQCIDEKDISGAMLQGRFNPDMDDIYLAHVGMGKPQRDQARIEHLERIGIPPEQQHDAFFNAEFRTFRDARWSERFGTVTDDHLFRLAQRMRPDVLPQNLDLTYSDLKGDPNVEALMNRLRSRQVSPAGLFMWGGKGSGDPFNFREIYKRMREDKYLPELREKVNENGMDLCSTGGSRSGAGRPDVSRTTTNGTDGTTCYADDAAGPCDTKGGSSDTRGAVKRADDGKCYADDFSACGKATAGVDEAIRRNAGDATGQDVANDGRCYADDVAGPDCNKVPKAAPVR